MQCPIIADNILSIEQVWGDIGHFSQPLELPHNPKGLRSFLKQSFEVFQKGRNSTLVPMQKMISWCNHHKEFYMLISQNKCFFLISSPHVYHLLTAMLATTIYHLTAMFSLNVSKIVVHAVPIKE